MYMHAMQCRVTLPPHIHPGLLVCASTHHSHYKKFALTVVNSNADYIVLLRQNMGFYVHLDGKNVGYL